VINKSAFIGRYNSKYLYFYMPDSAIKPVYRYQIIAKDKQLKPAKIIYMADGIRTYRATPNDNEAHDNIKYEMSYFLSKK